MWHNFVRSEFSSDKAIFSSAILTPSVCFMFYSIIISNNDLRTLNFVADDDDDVNILLLSQFRPKFIVATLITSAQLLPGCNNNSSSSSHFSVVPAASKHASKRFERGGAKSKIRDEGWKWK